MVDIASLPQEQVQRKEEEELLLLVLFSMCPL